MPAHKDRWWIKIVSAFWYRHWKYRWIMKDLSWLSQSCFWNDCGLLDFLRIILSTYRGENKDAVFWQRFLPISRRDISLILRCFATAVQTGPFQTFPCKIKASIENRANLSVSAFALLSWPGRHLCFRPYMWDKIILRKSRSPQSFQETWLESQLRSFMDPAIFQWRYQKALTI